jgi:hypothetical protein
MRLLTFLDDNCDYRLGRSCASAVPHRLVTRHTVSYSHDKGKASATLGCAPLFALRLQATPPESDRPHFTAGPPLRRGAERTQQPSGTRQWTSRAGPCQAQPPGFSGGAKIRRPPANLQGACRWPLHCRCANPDNVSAKAVILTTPGPVERN